MAKFYLTNKAIDDLTSIWNYTFFNWSEQQADKYYGILIDTCHVITKNPEFGKNHEGIAPTLFGLRAKRHIIFYRVISEHEVEITRILHENINLKKRIND